MEYAAEELEAARSPVYGPFREGEVRPPAPKMKTFKYVDGVERLSDMELPFLVDLRVMLLQNMLLPTAYMLIELLISLKSWKMIESNVLKV